MSDMTKEEKRSNFQGAMPIARLADESLPLESNVVEEQNSLLAQSFPAEARVRTHSVNDQGRCGACWAFSSAKLVESLFGGQVEISPQYVINCRSTKIFQNHPCQGGNVPYGAFPGIIQNGYKLEDEYPYRGRAGACPGGGKFINNLKMKMVDQEDGDGPKGFPSTTFIKDALVNKKVAISIIVNTEGGFFDYKGGIFNDSSCNDPRGDHQVTLVGYTKDYWLIQNSWGEYWGENGMIRIKYYEDLSQPKKCFCGGEGILCQVVYFYVDK